MSKTDTVSPQCIHGVPGYACCKKCEEMGTGFVPPDFESEEWNAERERLQQALIFTAMQLLHHTGASAFFYDINGLKINVEQEKCHTPNVTN